MLESGLHLRLLGVVLAILLTTAAGPEVPLVTFFAAVIHVLSVELEPQTAPSSAYKFGE